MPAQPTQEIYLEVAPRAEGESCLHDFEGVAKCKRCGAEPADVITEDMFRSSKVSAASTPAVVKVFEATETAQTDTLETDNETSEGQEGAMVPKKRGVVWFRNISKRAKAKKVATQKAEPRPRGSWLRKNRAKKAAEEVAHKVEVVEETKSPISPEAEAEQLKAKPAPVGESEVVDLAPVAIEGEHATLEDTTEVPEEPVVIPTIDVEAPAEKNSQSAQMSPSSKRPFVMWVKRKLPSQKSKKADAAPVKQVGRATEEKSAPTEHNDKPRIYDESVEEPVAASEAIIEVPSEQASVAAEITIGAGRVQEIPSDDEVLAPAASDPTAEKSAEPQDDKVAKQGLVTWMKRKMPGKSALKAEPQATAIVSPPAEEAKAEAETEGKVSTERPEDAATMSKETEVAKPDEEVSSPPIEEESVATGPIVDDVTTSGEESNKDQAPMENKWFKKIHSRNSSVDTGVLRVFKISPKKVAPVDDIIVVAAAGVSLAEIPKSVLDTSRSVLSSSKSVAQGEESTLDETASIVAEKPAEQPKRLSLIRKFSLSRGRKHANLVSTAEALAAPVVEKKEGETQPVVSEEVVVIPANAPATAEVEKITVEGEKAAVEGEATVAQVVSPKKRWFKVRSPKKGVSATAAVASLEPVATEAAEAKVVEVVESEVEVPEATAEAASLETKEIFVSSEPEVTDAVTAVTTLSQESEPIVAPEESLVLAAAVTLEVPVDLPVAPTEPVVVVAATPTTKKKWFRKPLVSPFKSPRNWFKKTPKKQNDKKDALEEKIVVPVILEEATPTAMLTEADIPAQAAVQQEEGAPVATDDEKSPVKFHTSPLCAGCGLKEVHVQVRWVPDDERPACNNCKSTWSMLRWRHHCRSCGEIVCGNCCKDGVYEICGGKQQMTWCNMCIQNPPNPMTYAVRP
eukprot:gb/GEZN01000993.1/.p1 GENE.gb/GEZN01000993.1/~~gb/GEZN01000993.1/.p1  ORF type:complete len:911 (+),score=192.10 gb/GEZN01000993.1/:308-3040(+)